MRGIVGGGRGGGWGGERNDPEDGQHHLASVAWSALALLAYEIRGMVEWDDRPGSIRADSPAAPTSSCSSQTMTDEERQWTVESETAEHFLHQFFHPFCIECSKGDTHAEVPSNPEGQEEETSED